MRDFVRCNLADLANELLYWRKHGQLPKRGQGTKFYKAAELLPWDDDAVKSVEHEVLLQSLEHAANVRTCFDLL